LRGAEALVTVFRFCPSHCDVMNQVVDIEVRRLISAFYNRDFELPQ